MTDALQIPLAAGDGGGFQILAVLAFVVISIVSGIIQKSNKAKKEAKDQEQARQRREQRTALRQQAPPAGTSQGLQVLAPSVGRQAPPPPAKARLRPPAGRSDSRIGLKPKKTTVGDRHVGSAHVGRLAHADDSTVVGEGLHVSLSTREAARQAMLLHEIFSPPKALREDKALWEM